jgi:hypothetical protein
MPEPTFFTDSKGTKTVPSLFVLLCSSTRFRVFRPLPTITEIYREVISKVIESNAVK